MRPPSQMPRERTPRSGRGRTFLIVAAVVFVFLATSLRGIARFYTDFLWFDSLGFGDVWSGVLGAKVALAVIFTGVFFVVMWLNLLIADRLAPAFRPAGPEEEMIERFEDMVGDHASLLRVAISLLFAVIAGAGASSEWNSWVLFTHGGSFGVKDPQFHTDIGFYVFKLPFLSYVAGWAFAALLIVFIVTAVAHYLNGGIRAQAPGPHVTSQVKAHLSVLLGLLALVRAFGYYLERYELNLSTRGIVDGAGYTDVHARLPAVQLLALISIASFGLFIFNIWRRGWVLPILGVGLWAVVALIVSGIYPQYVQRIQVKPNESARESTFIARNIEATRTALGLADVQNQAYAPNEDPDRVDLSGEGDTVRNIRLWDPNPEILQKTFQQEQGNRSYYKINDVDVDRYEIDGKLTQVVLAVRDLHTSGIEQTSWEARHLTFTHGQGMVVASANRKAGDDSPSYFVSDIPLRSTAKELELTRPQVYFGEHLDDYIVTGAKRKEIDYQANEKSVFANYEGRGGVTMGSPIRRAAFALRFGDYNPIISNFISPSSKIHYIRDVKERVEEIAPFLSFDADPYAVIHDGRIVYVIDGYTTTSNYPYAQRAQKDQLPEGSGLNHSFNYVRNSVKAVVDAYDGTVDLYVMPVDDPIIDAYRDAFPSLFDDFKNMPDDIKQHLRYPEDLFRVQSTMWGRYHLSQAEDFYNTNDAWSVSPEPNDAPVTPTSTPAAGGAAAANDVQITPKTTGRIDPYYLLLELPGEDTLDFVIARPFGPSSQVGEEKAQLTALMFGVTEPDGSSHLRVLVMPSSALPDGPTEAESTIQSDPAVSELRTLLNKDGSKVTFGNLLVLPIQDSLLYVRPFYVESSSTSIPSLRRVVVVFAGKVAVANTLDEALTALFGESPETGENVQPGDDTAPPGETADEKLSRLLTEANKLFAEAETALKAGDLGTYKTKNDQARAKVEQAARLIQGGSGSQTGGQGSGSSTTTTTAPGTTTTTEADSA